MARLAVYPITITQSEIEENSTFLLGELEGNHAVENFLDSVCYCVYEHLIYAKGNKILVDKIIERYRTALEPQIKKVLLQQAKYMLNSQTELGIEDGIVLSGSGATEIDIKTKILAPDLEKAVENIRPSLIYQGGFNNA